MPILGKRISLYGWNKKLENNRALQLDSLLKPYYFHMYEKKYLPQSLTVLAQQLST